jgi:hypothetical protein
MITMKDKLLELGDIMIDQFDNEVYLVISEHFHPTKDFGDHGTIVLRPDGVIVDVTAHQRHWDCYDLLDHNFDTAES